MPKTKNIYRWGPITLWAILAGILYYSWPLGNYLNPVANRGLASNLEAIGQPYNWLFIGLDIMTGVVIVFITVWLLQWLRNKKAIWLRSAIWGYGAFGVLTAIDAILPLDCVSTEQRCGAIISDPMVILHGIASIGSIGGLTVSIGAIWWLLVRSKHSGDILRWFLHLTAAGWLGFGIATALLLLASRSSALSQHLFISVCSLWTAVFPYMVWRDLRDNPRDLVIKKAKVR
jgi:hypothetical protein